MNCQLSSKYCIEGTKKWWENIFEVNNHPRKLNQEEEMLNQISSSTVSYTVTVVWGGGGALALPAASIVIIAHSTG